MSPEIPMLLRVSRAGTEINEGIVVEEEKDLYFCQREL